MKASSTTLAIAERNREAVRQAFERWREGSGNLFDLMAPDVRWEIAGRSAVAGTYPSKAAFMDQVIVPLNKRFARPLVPVVRHLYADGDTVVALFDAETLATDGLPYRNSYSWFLRFRDGSIVDVVAFFDSVAFNELWSRVSPA
jgi:ketosteroid isomerase-like protein